MSNTRPQTITQDVLLTMPDSSELPVRLRITAIYERNPFGKELPHYDGSDDGWTVEEVTIL